MVKNLENSLVSLIKHGDSIIITASKSKDGRLVYQMLRETVTTINILLYPDGTIKTSEGSIKISTLPYDLIKEFYDFEAGKELFADRVLKQISLSSVTPTYGIYSNGGICGK